MISNKGFLQNIQDFPSTCIWQILLTLAKKFVKNVNGLCKFPYNTKIWYAFFLILIFQHFGDLKSNCAIFTFLSDRIEGP